MYPSSTNNRLTTSMGSDGLSSASLTNAVSTTDYGSTNTKSVSTYSGPMSKTSSLSSIGPLAPLPTLTSVTTPYTSPFFPVSSTALRPTSFLHALASTPSVPYGLSTRTANVPSYPSGSSPTTTSSSSSSIPLYPSSLYGTGTVSSTNDYATNTVTSKLSIGSQQLLARYRHTTDIPVSFSSSSSAPNVPSTSSSSTIVTNLIDDVRHSVPLPRHAHPSDNVTMGLLDKHSIFLRTEDSKQRQHEKSISNYITKSFKQNRGNRETEPAIATVTTKKKENPPPNQHNISADSLPNNNDSTSLENELGEGTTARSRSGSVDSFVSSTELDTNIDKLLSTASNTPADHAPTVSRKPQQQQSSLPSVQPPRRDSVTSDDSTGSTQLILNLPYPIVASFRRVVAARENAIRHDFRTREDQLRRTFDHELQERMELAESSLNDLTDAFNQRIHALEQRQHTIERGRNDTIAANEAQLHAIEQENIHLRTRLMEIQTDLSKANMLRAQSETTLHDTVTNRDAAEQTVRTLTIRIEELLRIMEADRRHATNLQETVNKLQAEISTTTQAVTNEHTEVERLRGRCAGLEASEATLRKQLDEVAAMAAGDTGRLQREIVRLCTALADSNVTVATKEQELAGANDRIGRLNAKLATEQEAHLRGREAWEKEREEINTAIARMRGNWQVEREEAHTALTTARAAWDHEKDELTTTAALAREEAAKRSAAELADVVKMHTAESVAWTAKEKALTSQIQEYTILAETESTAAKRIGTELAALKDRLRSMETDAENMKMQYRTVTDERDRILSQLTHTENEYKRALASASEAHEARLTAALETAAADRAREVGTVRNELSSVRHSLNTAEIELEAVRAELDKEREHSAIVLNEAHAEVGRITERLRQASETSTNALRAQWEHEKQRIGKDHEAMVTALQAELTESANRAQQRLNEEHERYTKLSAMYDGANERIRDLESEALTLRQTIAEHRTELAHERAERHADATKYEKEITHLHNAVNDQDIRIRTLTSEISQLTASLTDERNEKERLLKELDTFNRTHRETVDYATKLEQVVDEARARLVAFERTVTEMKEARDTDVHALQDALTEARTTIGELTSSLEQQRSLLVTERELSNRLRTELASANDRELEARSFATSETGRASRLQSEANQATLNLQTALASAVTDLEHRVELVASLEAHTTELKAALEDARARAEKFSAEARIAAAEAAHAQAETATARTNGEILSRTLEETRAELAALHKAHTETLNDVRELRTALGSREGECAALTRRLESAIKEGEGHMRAIDKMNNERVRLEEELNNCRRDNSTAQAAVVAARLETEKAQAETTNAQHRTEALRAEVSVLLDRAERSETAMKMAQQARADAESRAAELGRETAEVRRNLGSSAAELQEAYNALERLRISEKKAKDEAEGLRVEAAKGRPDIDRLRGDLERTRMENDRLHDELRATKSENERIRADAARHAIQEDKYRTEAGNLHVETERAKGEAERYRAEAERARTEIERLRTEYAGSISGDGRMRLETERLRVTLNENEGIITGLRDRIRTLVDEARDNAARMIALETQVRDSQDVLRSKNAEIRTHEKDIAKHRARNEEMEAELRSLRSDVKNAREETARTTLTLRDTSRALEEALRAVDLERQATAEIRHHAGTTVAEATRVRREAEVKAVEAVAAADAELDSVTARAAERIADVTRTAEERITLATRRADEAHQELANKETLIAKLTEMISEYGSGMNTLRETLGLGVINAPLNNSTFINTEVVMSTVNKGNMQSLSADIRRNIRELTDFVTVLRRKSVATMHVNDGSGSNESTFGNKSNLSLNHVTMSQPLPNNATIADVLNNSTNSIRSLRLAVQGNHGMMSTTRMTNNSENIPPANIRLNNSTASAYGTTSKSFSIHGIRPLPAEPSMLNQSSNTVGIKTTATIPSIPNSVPSTPLRNSTVSGIPGWKITSNEPNPTSRTIPSKSTNAIVMEQESMLRNDTMNNIISPTYSQLDDSQVSIPEDILAPSSVTNVQTNVQKLPETITKLNDSTNTSILLQYIPSPAKGKDYEPSKYITVQEPYSSSSTTTSSPPSSPSGSRIFVRVRADEDKAPLPVIEPTPRNDNGDAGFGTVNNSNNTNNNSSVRTTSSSISVTNEPIIATALESAFPSKGGVRRGGGRRTVAFTNGNDPDLSIASDTRNDIGPTTTTDTINLPSLPSSRSTSSVRGSITVDSLDSSSIPSRPPSATALMTASANTSVNLSSSLAVLDTATVSQLIGDSRRSKEIEQRMEMAEMETQRVRYAAEKALQVMSNPAMLGMNSSNGTDGSSSLPLPSSVMNPVMNDFSSALGKAMELASKVNIPPSTTNSSLASSSPSRASSTMSSNSVNATLSRNGAGSMALGSNVSSTAFTAILPHSTILPSASSTSNSTSASPIRRIVTADKANTSSDKLNLSNSSGGTSSRPAPRPLVHFEE